MFRYRTRPLLTAAAAVGAAVSLTVPIGRAGADPLAGYSAAAAAVGTRVTYGVPGFLTVERFLDAGGPVSQAVSDSAGRQSFASMPYPGDLVVGLPGLIALGLGQAPPAGYPLHAAASYPVAPKGEVGDANGPYHLLALADASAASSDARSGVTEGDGPRQGARTLADVVERDGKVVASARSTIRGFQIPGVLSIAVVRSQSITTYAGGAPVTETALSVEGGRIGDLAFSYGPEGFAVGGTAVGSPSDPLEAINEALQPTGVSLRVVAPAPVNGGGAAEVLEIASTQAVPLDGSKGTLHAQLGGATSSVVLGSVVTPSLPPQAPVGAPHPTPGTAAPATSAPARPAATQSADTSDLEAATAVAPAGTTRRAAPADATISAGQRALSPEPATPVFEGATGVPSGSGLPLRLVVQPQRQSGTALVFVLIMASGLAVLTGYVVWQRRLGWTS